MLSLLLAVEASQVRFELLSCRLVTSIPMLLLPRVDMKSGDSCLISSVTKIMPWQRLWRGRAIPDAKPDCCKGILWDLITVYPAGAEWGQNLPPVTVFNGPVVREISRSKIL
jgi:hypothetical protein